MKTRIVILLIPILVLAGCWDKRELNDLAITLALGIDKADDKILLSAQVVVPSEVSMQMSSGRTKVIMIQAEGETIYEAVRKLTLESPRRTYPGHLRVLVISEELAREGIGDSLDLLSRDWEIRSDFYVTVAKDQTAAEILNVTTVMENIPANEMFNTLKTSEKNWAATKAVTLDELLENMISEGKEPVLTGIYIIGNQQKGKSNENVEMISPSAKIQYDNLAVLKEDKLVGWLTEEESRGYNDIINSVKTTVASITCPDEGKASIEIINFKTDVKGSVTNGEPKVDINVKANGNVGAVECHINLRDQKTIATLERTFEEQVKGLINHTIKTVQQKYNADIFGFGQAIHRSNPKEWEKMEYEWDEKFVDLKVSVKVDMKIHGTGTLNNTYIEKLKD